MARFDMFSAVKHSAKTRVAAGGSPESITGARHRVSKAIDKQITNANAGKQSGKALWYKKLDTANLWTISLRYGNQMIYMDEASKPKSDTDGGKPFFGEFNSLSEVAEAYGAVQEDVMAGKCDSGIQPAWDAAKKRGAALKKKRAEEKAAKG